MMTVPASGPSLAPGLSPSGRAELKHCVPAELATVVLSAARAHLAPDPHAPQGSQTVTSLYLDTPDLTFLTQHRTQAPDRVKLRIRRYGDIGATVVWAEVKRKTGGVVRKYRTGVPASGIDTLLGAGTTTGWGGWTSDRWSLRAFLRLRESTGAGPTVLVRYQRESLRDRHPLGPDAITLDRRLEFQATPGCSFGDPAVNWRRLPLPHDDPSLVVLELKYGSTPPDWMLPLIAELRPWRVPFSKYVAAMSPGQAPCVA